MGARVIKHYIFLFMVAALIFTTAIMPVAYAGTAQTMVSESGSYLIRNHMTPVNYVKNVGRTDEAKITIGNMKMSAAGLAVIRGAEGFRAAPYNHDGRLSIGYGTTRGVRVGMRVTEAQAEHLLRLDAAFAEEAVNRMVRVPLTQGQFDALCSWTYNIGEGGLAKSKMLELLNQSDYAAAGSALLTYDHIHGHRSHGLDIRRGKEHALYVSEPAPEQSVEIANR